MKPIYTLKEWAEKNNPQLLKQWDYEKNEIDIDKVGYKSSKHAYWICEKGHSYESPISKKVDGHRCIYCSNRALLRGFNDLETLYPEISKDWNDELNDVKPSDIIFCDKKTIVNWKCHICGYEWKGTVKVRTMHNSLCKMCGIKKASVNRHINYISENRSAIRTYPTIFEDWDYELNQEKPSDLIKSDKRSFFWRCKKYNHSFPATIAHRISNPECVYCSNKMMLTGFNDLLTKKNEIIDEWDYKRNIVLPSQVLFNDKKTKVYWKCRFCGKEILSAPGYHNVPGCRSCRTIQKSNLERKKRIESGLNLFDSKYKELLLDWDYEKNNENGIFIKELTPRYTKKVSWKCHICGYEWQTSLYKRTVEKNGCRVCKNFVLKEGVNDLKTKFPELVEEWSEKNNISPTEVLAGGMKNYWWKCRFCGNEWKATIHNRTYEGSNCSKCGGYNTSFPEQAIYYYFKKIYKNSQNRFIEEKSKKEIDIYVPEVKLGIEFDGYEYHKDKLNEDDNKTRLLKEQGINVIRIREDKGKNILPELNVKPYKVYHYDSKKKFASLDEILIDIFLNLKINTIEVNSFNDRFQILHIMHLGFREKSFEKNSNGHLKYWDYELNNPLMPNEISPGSKIVVNWKCPMCNHKWSRSVSDELRSKGCSDCNKTIRSKNYNLQTERPNSKKYWDYKRNNKGPEDVSPNTHIKYWFICSSCGISYETTPSRWAENGECVSCSKERGRRKRCKKVAQYTLKGEYINTYESAREAYEKTGISYKSISTVCNNGRKKQTGGFIWKFVE